MSLHDWLMLAPMLALLGTAAAIDLRSRRIPNWLTLSLAGSGLLLSMLGASLIPPTAALLGLLTGFALNLGLFLLRIRGGGDVKLFAAAGAWVGPIISLEVFVLATLFAALCAIAQASIDGRLGALLRNTTLIAWAMAGWRQGGLEAVTEHDGSFRSVGKPVPYAVPILLSMLIVLFRYAPGIH